MSTGPVSRRRTIGCSRWFMPAVSVALGVIMLAAMWVGGHRSSAPAIMSHFSTRLVRVVGAAGGLTDR